MACSNRFLISYEHSHTDTAQLFVLLIEVIVQLSQLDWKRCKQIFNRRIVGRKGVGYEIRLSLREQQNAGTAVVNVHTGSICQIGIG